MIMRGQTVMLRKGAEVRTMHPARDRYTLKRNQSVKVHSAHAGYELDGVSHPAEISWAGTGGYWCYAKQDDIITSN